MTATLAPPGQPIGGVPPSRERASARRAVRRWAWRLLRREWRQQLLVLGLLTLAVATTTVGLGVVVNIQGTVQGVFGTADTRMEIASPGTSGVAADLAAARRRFGTAEAITHEQVPVPGSITPVDLRAQTPNGPFSAPMLRLISGHYPIGPDEAAVTTAVAATLHLTMGSTWSADGRSLTIVGIVENPNDLQDAFGLLAPGQISSPASLTLLFDATTNQLTGFRPPAGTVQRLYSSGANAAERQRNQALAVLILATIGLIFIGLLSVAGFAVIAQRRLRALGMIGAIGATDRQVRGVMLANGAAVGTVSALGGMAVGLAAWFALTPALQNVVGNRYDPLDLPWWAVAAAAVLAVLTAQAAAWWPARAAARLPIVAALSGRPAPPKPAHRFALVGVALSAVGFESLVLSQRVHTVLVLAGIVATIAGVLLLAPLGIRGLATVADRAPVAVRLSLRDLARYQTRSGAALAAATLAVAIAATIAVTAAAQQAHDRTLTGGNLPTNELIVWLNNPNPAKGPGLVARPAGSATTTPALPSATVLATGRSTAEAIARAVRATTVVELDRAVNLNATVPPGAPPDATMASLVHTFTVAGQGHGWTVVATPYVATPAVLGFYRLSAAGIHTGVDILTSRTDLAGAQIGTGVKGSFQAIAVQVSALLPNYTSAPNTLITPAEMTAQGYTAEPVGWLVQSPHSLTPAQISDARGRAAAAGVSTEVRTGPDNSLQDLRDYATLAGILVALGVLAMTVGLIRSEAAGDLRTLTAAGASGTTRRTLNATSAGALAVLAGVLGTAAAYLALIAWHWHDVRYLDQPPYANLTLLLLGLPAVAATAAWLLGRTPTAIARRPRE